LLKKSGLQFSSKESRKFFTLFSQNWLSERHKASGNAQFSAAEALTREEPFINQNLTYQALGMLTQLLRDGSVSYQGGFCNLATGQLAPLPVRAAEPTIPPSRRR
jgi:hypothetical protein